MSDRVGVEYLEWDSHFFGLRIARASGPMGNAAAAEKVLSWCKGERIDCVYYLGESEDAASTAIAQEHGFRMVDIRITLARAVTAADAPPAIRPFITTDLKALKSIAAVSHTDTRFYADARFPRALCDKLYETWIENSCHGYADTVLVAEADGRAVGYVTCHLRPNSEGQVGLIAVDAKEQGHGLGRALIDASLAWFAGHGLKRCTVPTQGRNIRATRLYERCGFQTAATQIWFHRWLTPKAGGAA